MFWERVGESERSGVKGRAYQAGLAMGLSIIEMVHLMYQNDTAKRFYQGLFAVLRKEFKRRKVT